MMGAYADMARLLRPLGIYDVDEGYGAEELRVLGGALDAAAAEMERLEGEFLLPTAEGEGLDAWEELFPYRPVCTGAEERRRAIAALLRIDGRSFTAAALNDTLTGCGIVARVEESGTPMAVTVSFPETRGLPEGFDGLSRRIESILPCHLQVGYRFRFPLWGEIDDAALTWGAVDAACELWEDIERFDPAAV